MESVKVTDLDIPFWRMVALVFKLQVASLVASLVFSCVFGTLGFLLASLLLVLGVLGASA